MRRPGRIHVGHRGRILLFFGSLDLVYSVSLVAPDRATQATPFFIWLDSIMPLWFWAIAWGAVGVVCIWQALCRRDQLGFTAAACLKIYWGLVCLGGWLFGATERGYVSAMIWIGLAYVMARVLAPWPEPGDVKGPTWIRPSS